MDDFNYGAYLVKALGSLDRGGKIKLTTETGEAKWKNLSADQLRRIAAIVAEPEPGGSATSVAGVGPDLTMELIAQWIKNEPKLSARARQLLDADDRDRTALTPWWVEPLLYGTPRGPFRLDREPKPDAQKVRSLKGTISRDDFFKVDWETLRIVVQGR